LVCIVKVTSTSESSRLTSTRGGGGGRAKEGGALGVAVALVTVETGGILGGGYPQGFIEDSALQPSSDVESMFPDKTNGATEVDGLLLKILLSLAVVPIAVPELVLVLVAVPAPALVSDVELFTVLSVSESPMTALSCFSQASSRRCDT
jgi:hypothetical protein